MAADESVRDFMRVQGNDLVVDSAQGNVTYKVNTLREVDSNLARLSRYENHPDIDRLLDARLVVRIMIEENPSGKRWKGRGL